MAGKTYYQILQVNPAASPEVIEAAYRRLARIYHPDVNHAPNAMLQMQAINEAYACLSDGVKRRTYDVQQAWAAEYTSASATCGLGPRPSQPICRLWRLLQPSDGYNHHGYYNQHNFYNEYNCNN